MINDSSFTNVNASSNIKWHAICLVNQTVAGVNKLCLPDLAFVVERMLTINIFLLLFCFALVFFYTCSLNFIDIVNALGSRRGTVSIHCDW